MAFDPVYLVAFIMGLFSSFHCIGMCGSIIGALTLSLSREIRLHKQRLTPFVLSYNLGRILSYSMAGLIAFMGYDGVIWSGWRCPAQHSA